ncbi:MAG: carbohydrate-binding protein [Colwellia sp.]
MIENKLLLALSLTVATSLTACGGGDADQNVVRNLFAVGDIVEGLEDGDPIEGDVSENDQGEDLTYALADNSETGNGTLVFNGDGTFTYTPNADFSGKDSYTYIVNQSTTGETDTAVLTINVLSDFETLAEAGWVNRWHDDFDGDSLDSNIWVADNAIVTDGNLVISAQDDITAEVKTVEKLPYGRFEASIQLPADTDVYAAFTAIPMADMYDGDNRFDAFELTNNDMIAGAHYGLGLVNGVSYNNDTVVAASNEFHTYAVEWNEEKIRWYFDGKHIYTVDTLNLWAYNMVDGEVVANVYSPDEPAGPFNQDLQLAFTLASSSAEPIDMLVDYVNVFTCDPTIAPEITACAAKLSSAIDKVASDRIPTISSVTTELFKDGVFDKEDKKTSDLELLSWHYIDEKDITVENNPISIGIYNEATVEIITLENEHDLVIDVSHAEGDANIHISAANVELIGHDAILSFDMYIDSANTLTETLDIKMETAWPYLGMLTWNVTCPTVEDSEIDNEAEVEVEPIPCVPLTLDTWVTYVIPVSDFINAPFIAPDWLNWIPGIVEGDALPLDTSDITSLLTVEFHGGVHFQLDNIQLSCISNESCIQGPLAVLASASAAPSTTYQAENWDEAGEVEVEDTADEGGGQNVGYIDPDDFLQYTITAPSDGTYSIDYRLASSGGSDGFELSIDGSVVDIQTVEDTGGWQEWATQSSVEFELTAGEHTVRYDFIGGSINFNWFEVFEPVFEIFIEAESFEEAGEVELEDTADEGGGQNVGYIDPGDFLQYTVNIPADGTYNITYRIASSGGSEGFETTVGGVVVDTQTVEDTGDWQNWASQTAVVDLVAGEQTLRLDFLGGSININWIKITN